MKHCYETEEEFSKRFHEAKIKGICVFRDDKKRELILDLMYDYMDLVDSITL